MLKQNYFLKKFDYFLKNILFSRDKGISCKNIQLHGCIWISNTRCCRFPANKEIYLRIPIRQLNKDRQLWETQITLVKSHSYGLFANANKGFKEIQVGGA